MTAENFPACEFTILAAGFKAYKREFVAQLPVYGEMQRLIPISRAATRLPDLRNSHHHRARESMGHRNMDSCRRFLFSSISSRCASLRDICHGRCIFFGTAGHRCGICGGAPIAFWLLIENLIYHTNVLQEHGPLMFFCDSPDSFRHATIRIGPCWRKMQVRHFHDRGGRAIVYRHRGAAISPRKMTKPIRQLALPIPSPTFKTRTILRTPTGISPEFFFFWALIYIPGLASPGMMDDADFGGTRKSGERCWPSTIL